MPALLGLMACASPEPEKLFDLVENFARAQVEESRVAVDDGDAPPTRPGADFLFLRAGSAISVALDASTRNALRAERVALRGSNLRLSVSVAADGIPDPLRTETAESRRNWSVEFDLPQPAPVLVTLRAASDSPQAGDGVLIAKPAIWDLTGGRSDPVRQETAGQADWTDPAEWPERPNVIIYLIDTLRRDRLGAYGYDRPVSPNIDAFAAEATLFENSIGQASWTKPSVASMFSGVWPPEHGATGWKHKMPEERDLLAEILRDAGYATAGFVTNVNASKAFGLAQGFEHLWYRRVHRADLVNDRVFPWLDGYDDARPLFLYVHTVDPHAVYDPVEPYRSRFAPTADQQMIRHWAPKWKWPAENAPFFSDLYDGEIAQNDAAFGAFIKRLRDDGLYEKSLIVLIADHGEEFLEHGGWRHNRTLHGESLDVPIIVKFPHQRRGSRTRTLASHVDVLPTALDVIGLPIPEWAEGQSLTTPEAGPVFSHLKSGKVALRYSVVHGHWKLIQIHREEVRTKLFNLQEDPGETEDLSQSLPVRAALLGGLLRERLARGKEATLEDIELTDEVEQSLRALGYLE